VTSSSALTPADPNQSVSSTPVPVSTDRNPSYPQRTHYAEKKALEEKLRSWQEKVAEMGKKLTSLGNHPIRATYVRLYFQMLGALDQMAEAVSRMPLEAGVLYDEDREKLRIAEAALALVFRRWDAVKS
jgi:hypothetical protein